MPVTYEVNSWQIHVVAEGRVGMVDFRDHLVERSRDRRVHPDMCELFDATRVDRIDLTPSDIGALVQCQRDHAPLFLPIPLAIVTLEPVAFYARTFQTLVGPADRMIRVFRSHKHAHGWLWGLQAVTGRRAPACAFADAHLAGHVSAANADRATKGGPDWFPSNGDGQVEYTEPHLPRTRPRAI